MVKRIIWPVNVGDWQRDTSHLTVSEEGAYFRLCCHYWSAGRLPDDERDIQRIAKIYDNRNWARAKPRLQAFFHNGWQHKRIDEDIAKAAAFSAKQVDNAKASHVQRAHHSGHTTGERYTRGKNTSKNNGRGPATAEPNACLPSSFNKEAKPSLLQPPQSQTAGSLATAPLKGALRSPASEPNKFQQAWMTALERQLEPQVYAEAIGYLLADKETRDRITSAEIRECGSGVMAAVIAWQRWKKQQP